MKRNCDTCKWNDKEDCINILSINNCSLPSYPLWEAKESFDPEDTIVEYAFKHAELNLPDSGFNNSYRSFLAGAKCQEEISDTSYNKGFDAGFTTGSNQQADTMKASMYSEEELINFIGSFVDKVISGNNEPFSEWFAKNKK